MDSGFLPTLGLRWFQKWAEETEQRGETEEVNAELQKSFIRHATEVMQNTQERPWEGKLKKQETKSHLLFVKK